MRVNPNTGEYLERATARLMVVVPFTLLIVFVLLYLTFRRVDEAVLIMAAVPFAASAEAPLRPNQATQSMAGRIITRPGLWGGVVRDLLSCPSSASRSLREWAALEARASSTTHTRLGG